MRKHGGVAVQRQRVVELTVQDLMLRARRNAWRAKVFGRAEQPAGVTLSEFVALAQAAVDLGELGL